MLKEYEYKKALKLLDELLDKYNIPNKKSEDGIARIDGLVVDEYFDKIDLFDDIIDEREICEDMSNIGSWGTGNVQIKLRSDADVDYIMGLIKQSFENGKNIE